MGKRPYIGKTKGDIKRSLLCKSIKVEENDLPSYIKYNNKAAICDFVNKLLNRKAVSRIGANGIEEITLKFTLTQDGGYKVYANKKAAGTGFIHTIKKENKTSSTSGIFCGLLSGSIVYPTGISPSKACLASVESIIIELAV